MMSSRSISNKIYEILSRRKLRDESFGGYGSLTVGPPGCGKTSQLLFEAKKFMEWSPTEIVFWRDSNLSAAQFNRIGDNWKVFTEKDCTLRFRDLIRGGSINVEYTTFDNFDTLINRDTGKGLVEPGKLNVIYFKDDYKWIDLLKHLRGVIGWQSVFIDEIEDIIPLNPSKRKGDERNIRLIKNIEFSSNAKEIRKGLVNLLCNTQSIDELDWRFKRKLNFIVYLRGARVGAGSRIKQIAIDKLSIGECFIDWETRMYGKSVFDSFPPRRPVYEVIVE